jgi:hypothetical protein
MLKPICDYRAREIMLIQHLLAKPITGFHNMISILTTTEEFFVKAIDSSTRYRCIIRLQDSNVGFDYKISKHDSINCELGWNLVMREFLHTCTVQTFNLDRT